MKNEILGKLFKQFLIETIDAEKYAFSDIGRSDARNLLGLKDELTIMHVGNFKYEKNHQFLIQVFFEIKQVNKDAKLILIGGGDSDLIKKQSQSLGIAESVIFMGVRNDVFHLLQAGDFFIFPSLYEGFPGAVLEAQASGMNCIISDSITEEVMLTKNIKMISLSEGPKAWANLLGSFEPVNRKDAWIEIKKAKYDIGDLVLNTEAFFDDLTKNTF